MLQLDSFNFLIIFHNPHAIFKMAAEKLLQQPILSSFDQTWSDLKISEMYCQ